MPVCECWSWLQLVLLIYNLNVYYFLFIILLSIFFCIFSGSPTACFKRSESTSPSACLAWIETSPQFCGTTAYLLNENKQKGDPLVEKADCSRNTIHVIWITYPVQHCSKAGAYFRKQREQDRGHYWQEASVLPGSRSRLAYEVT